MLSSFSVLSQGTVVFDQQSSTDETPYPYGSFGPIQDLAPPWGQSFTPGLSSVRFIRLNFVDGNTDDGLGATVYVNLHSGSISGPIIGVTAPVAMPTLFRGVSEFDFSSEIALTPGTTYYFEPILQSGGTWNIAGRDYNYPGGSIYVGGQPFLQTDLWFREGTVPEPSVAALAALGLLLTILKHHHKR